MFLFQLFCFELRCASYYCTRSSRARVERVSSASRARASVNLWVDGTVAGKSVCQNLWIPTLGISSGCLKISKSTERAPLQKSHEAIAWMHSYFNLVGDYMPIRMVVHLPSNLSKLSVYQRMVVDMTNRKKDSIVSKSHFFRLWEEHFSHVNIPKVCSQKQMLHV